MTAAENTMEAVIYGGPGLITVERRPIPVLEADSKNEVVVKCVRSSEPLIEISLCMIC
jgi:hypothetical protein